MQFLCYVSTLPRFHIIIIQTFYFFNYAKKRDIASYWYAVYYALALICEKYFSNIIYVRLIFFYE